MIVLVEQGEFDDYYELMCQGAYDYFELSSGADPIARAVRGASRALAA